MDDNKLIISNEMSLVVQEVKSILNTARNNVARQVNNELLNTYWNIGRIICEYEQTDAARADYGKQTLRALSKELTKEFGKGFWQRIFCIKHSVYASVLSKLSNSTDSVC